MADFIAEIAPHDIMTIGEKHIVSSTEPIKGIYYQFFLGGHLFMRQPTVKVEVLELCYNTQQKMIKLLPQ